MLVFPPKTQTLPHYILRAKWIHMEQFQPCTTSAQKSKNKFELQARWCRDHQQKVIQVEGSLSKPKYSCSQIHDLLHPEVHSKHSPWDLPPWCVLRVWNTQKKKLQKDRIKRHSTLQLREKIKHNQTLVRDTRRYQYQVSHVSLIIIAAAETTPVLHSMQNKQWNAQPDLFNMQTQKAQEDI